MAYAERQDIENIFGVANVAKWADLENEGSSSTIADRITWALDQATTKMENRLRGGPYDVPFEEPYDPELIEHTARWAGVMLYDSRGITDTQDETDDGTHALTAHLKMVKEFIADVHAGRIRLDVTSTERAPRVIKDCE